MNRILILCATLAVAACGASPEDIAGKRTQIKDGVVVGCEGLDDAFVAATVDVIAELTGTTSGVDAIRARRKQLCASAAAPVDPVGELTPPIPVEKPRDG